MLLDVVPELLVEELPVLLLEELPDFLLEEPPDFFVEELLLEDALLEDSPLEDAFPELPVFLLDEVVVELVVLFDDLLLLDPHATIPNASIHTIHNNKPFFKIPFILQHPFFFSYFKSMFTFDGSYYVFETLIVPKRYLKKT